MTDNERLLGEHACIRLCHDFAASVDARRYDDFVALFTVDGVFDRAGQISHGHAEIRRFLDARPADRVTRHACTNICVDLVSPDSAVGNCYALVFQVQGTDTPPGPLHSPAPMVVEYHDQYRRGPEGWKFNHRRVKIVFQP